jgi:hypothetical protein
MKKKRIYRYAANKIRQLFAEKHQDAAKGESGSESETASYPEPGPPTTTEPLIQRENAESGATNASDNQENPGSNSYGQAQLRLTRWLVGATVVIAAATVIYMIISALQLGEIRSGGQDTRKLAQAAQESANAASEQVNAMRGQLNTMQDQANSMKTQTNTMEESLGLTNRAVTAGEKQANTSQVSARAAEASARTASEAYTSSQRPEVFIKTNRFPIGFKVGELLTVAFGLHNNGGTATKVVISGSHVYRPAGERGSLPCRPVGGDKTEAPLYTGGDFLATIEFDLRVSDTTEKSLENKVFNLFIFGVIGQESRGGRKHLTPYCRMYDKGSPDSMMYCPKWAKNECEGKYPD